MKKKEAFNKLAKPIKNEYLILGMVAAVAIAAILIMASGASYKKNKIGYTSGDYSDTSGDLAGGATQTISPQSVGVGYLRLGGRTYKVVSAASPGSNDFPVKVDINANNVIGDFSKIIIGNEYSAAYKDQYIYLEGYNGLLQYKGADKITSDNPVMRFKDVSTGNAIEIAYNVSSPVNQANATGTLSVTSTPTGAQILIDNIYQGVTPKFVYNVRQGVRSIYLNMQGYNGNYGYANVIAGQTVNYNAVLRTNQSSLSAPLMVTSTPTGAEIWMDGALQGITPKTIANAPIGRRTMYLKKHGYNGYYGTAEVFAERTNYFPAALTANITANQMGSISIDSLPTNSNIYIDGIYQGITPKTAANVKPGIRLVYLTKDGFTSYLNYTNVEAGKTTSVHAYLAIKQNNSIQQK